MKNSVVICQHPHVPCPSFNGVVFIPLIRLIEQVHIEEVPLLRLLPAELGVQGQHEIPIRCTLHGRGRPWGNGQPKDQAQQPRDNGAIGNKTHQYKAHGTKYQQMQGKTDCNILDKFLVLHIFIIVSNKENRTHIICKFHSNSIHPTLQF